MCGRRLIYVEAVLPRRQAFNVDYRGLLLRRHATRAVVLLEVPLLYVVRSMFRASIRLPEDMAAWKVRDAPCLMGHNLTLSVDVARRRVSD